MTDSLALHDATGRIGAVFWPAQLPNPAAATDDELRAAAAVDLSPYAPVKARIHRTAAAAGLNPTWVWQCDPCGERSSTCAHPLIHHTGTWAAAMCGGFRHVHLQHPRPPVPGFPGWAHAMFGARRRCDATAPSDAERRFASHTLCGRTGYPRGAEARTTAREVLALAGIRAPG